LRRNGVPAERITERQAEVLMLIARNPGVTGRDLAAMLGCSAVQGCIQTVSSLIRKNWVSCDCKITAEGATRLEAVQMQEAREAAEYVRAIRKG
jgi:chromosome segregation and condensation protein ScpB